jgi:aminomuconate-semialdehyde/2-hydroxymuconate-6-semialdehyde dehydrogenase
MLKSLHIVEKKSGFNRSLSEGRPLNLISVSNFIDGRPAFTPSSLPVINPALATEIARVPDSQAEDVDKAVAAAERAFPQWSQTPARERARYLHLLADKIQANAEELARLETLNTGKPLSLSRTIDIPRSEQNLRYFADLITTVSEESGLIPTSPKLHATNTVVSSSLGVVATISPWNLPLYLFTWKIAPALAAGNTVVAKPSELTPLTAYRLGQFCQEIGLPAGVLNIVHGTGAAVGEALTLHPHIKAISFTGSTLVGKKIAVHCSHSLKKFSLEMGGKNPAIVFADCDFDRTVAEVARATFTHQGQICLCASRLLIHESIYTKFKQALIAQVAKLKVGDPLAPTTQQGALISQTQMEKVLSYRDLAVAEGGKILIGGERISELPGYFIAPTLVEGLSNASRFNQEEIFGPIASLIPFSNTEEAIQLANATHYGLAASVWTQNSQLAGQVSRELQFGIVWVNTWLNRHLATPFGGVKDSGFGREGGRYALQFFSETKTICEYQA